MRKSLIFVTLLSILTEGLCADLNCSIWFSDPNRDCCKFDLPIDEDFSESISKEFKGKNLSYCNMDAKATELLNLTTYDRATYSKVLKSIIKNPAWAPTIDKGIDICIDLAPRYETTILSKQQPNEKHCETKTILTLHCIYLVGFWDCPGSKLTESSICKEQKASFQVCAANPDAIVKAVEYLKPK